MLDKRRQSTVELIIYAAVSILYEQLPWNINGKRLKAQSDQIVKTLAANIFRSSAIEVILSSSWETQQSNESSKPVEIASLAPFPIS